MAAPYTIAWVGVWEAPPPHDNTWHLAWLTNDAEGIEDKTLCRLGASDRLDQLSSMMTAQEMRRYQHGTSAGTYQQCAQCVRLYQTILYMRMEEGKSLEDLRA